MKISMIEIVSSHGGMNYYDYGLLNSLGKLGHEVTLYTSSPLLFDISKNKNIKVNLVYENLFNINNRLLKLIKYIRGTIRALKESKKNYVKIIHFQIFAITYLEYFVVKLCKLMGFKVIVTVHDVESFNKQNAESLTNRFYKIVDELIVHNNVSYEVLSLLLRKIDENKLYHCHIIPHGSYIGMLPEKLLKSSAKKIFGIDENVFTILFFGQIKKVKGLDVLLESLPSLIQKSKKKIKVIIAGKIWKDDVDYYHEIINRLGIKEFLILEIKYIADEDVVKYYSAADCIVLPYKQIFQSGVLLMAQSYYVPVVVSNLDGMIEIVQHGKNGFVFKSESCEDLTKCLLDVINRDDLDDIAKNAYDYLSSNYNWDIIAEKQAEVMKKML